MFYADGSRYEGEFKKGLQHGEGKFFDATGKLKKNCYYEHGEEKVLQVGEGGLTAEKGRLWLRSVLIARVSYRCLI